MYLRNQLSLLHLANPTTDGVGHTKETGSSECVPLVVQFADLSLLTYIDANSRIPHPDVLISQIRDWYEFSTFESSRLLNGY